MGTFNINTIQASGGRSLANVQVFSAPGTWVKPTDVDYIYIEVIGGAGGGGHGSGPNPNPAGQPGGCGGFGLGYMDVQNLDPASVPVTVGVGGVGGQAPVGGAAAGTSSSFHTYLISTGGGLGSSGPAVYVRGVGGSASGPAMVWHDPSPPQPNTARQTQVPHDMKVPYVGDNSGLGSMNFGLGDNKGKAGVGGVGGVGGWQPGPTSPPTSMVGTTGGDGLVAVWGYSS